MTTMTPMTSKDRVLSILRGINRPGMDTVISNLESDGYFRARCYSHHNYAGGAADHSLEVYDYMMKHFSAFLPSDTIAIAALFHDLGKCHAGRKYRGKHPVRALRLLDHYGLELTEQERLAIGHHHSHDETYFTCPARFALSTSDVNSAHQWCGNHRTA